MYVLGFTILIGIMMEFIHATKADQSFINLISTRFGVNTPTKARFVPLFIGSLIFTDTNLSIVSSGISSRSLFDRFKIPRQVLAFIVDATCAPVSVLVLLNGWGAYISQLLATNGVDDSMSVTFGSIQYNFYPIITILFAFFTALTGKYFGPLAKSEFQDDGKTLNYSDYSMRRVMVLVVPLISVVVLTLALLLYTGNGDIREGSGSFSVFFAVVLSIVIQLILCLTSCPMKGFNDYVRTMAKGAFNMKDMTIIMFLAFMFGSVIKTLGTGEYLSSLTQSNLEIYLIPAAVFLLSAFVGFTTGTSWGTYGLMIPLAAALSDQVGIDITILTAAVLGGGVFGDHASPLSDTTILSSMISDIDLTDHVYTQLPYAIAAAIISSILYVAVSF